MRWHRYPSLLLVLAAACGDADRERPRASFSYEEPAQPVRAVVLRSDTVRSVQGYRVVDIHLFFQERVTEAAARATLQHIIDSVAAADTLAAAVSALGFVMETPAPGATEANLLPAIRALWAPLDTVGTTGSRRRARFRTAFTILRAFGDTAAQGTR